MFWPTLVKPFLPFPLRLQQSVNQINQSGLPFLSQGQEINKGSRHVFNLGIVFSNHQFYSQLVHVGAPLNSWGFSLPPPLPPPGHPIEGFHLLFLIPNSRKEAKGMTWGKGQERPGAMFAWAWKTPQHCHGNSTLGLQCSGCWLPREPDCTRLQAGTRRERSHNGT